MNPWDYTVLFACSPTAAILLLSVSWCNPQVVVAHCNLIAALTTRLGLRERDRNRANDMVTRMKKTRYGKGIWLRNCEVQVHRLDWSAWKERKVLLDKAGRKEAAAAAEKAARRAQGADETLTATPRTVREGTSNPKPSGAVPAGCTDYKVVGGKLIQSDDEEDWRCARDARLGFGFELTQDKDNQQVCFVPFAAELLSCQMWCCAECYHRSAPNASCSALNGCCSTLSGCCMLIEVCFRGICCVEFLSLGEARRYMQA